MAVAAGAAGHRARARLAAEEHADAEAQPPGRDGAPPAERKGKEHRAKGAVRSTVAFAVSLGVTWAGLALWRGRAHEASHGAVHWMRLPDDAPSMEGGAEMVSSREDVQVRRNGTCPHYSGPGYDAANMHFAEDVAIASVRPRLGARDVAGARTRFLATPEPYRLELTDDGSRYAEAAATNARYLLALEPDRFLATFRANAKLAPAKAPPYGGWEHPTCELRGHFLGHYISALSQAAAFGTTGAEERAEAARRVRHIVRELREVQNALGGGYLSAFPSEFLDRFDAHKPVWAPLYTLHKLLRGLLDANHLLGIDDALEVALRLAEYLKARVDRVVEERGEDWHTASLHMEYGGVNEVAYRLAARVANNATRRRTLAELGRYFEKPCFSGRLLADAAGVASPGPSDHDGLGGMHANTHYPILHGSQTLAEFYTVLTESPNRAVDARSRSVLMLLSEHFVSSITQKRSYATGGSTHVEIFAHSHHLGETVADALAEQPEWANAHQESCTSVNMIATARALLRWRGATTASVEYAELIEKLLLNGVLGTQRGVEPGVMLYMTGLGPGASKAGKQHWRPTGWGDAHNSFWCCYGTLVEAFASLPSDVFAIDTENDEVLVVQLMSAKLTLGSGAQVIVEAVAPSMGSPRLSVRVVSSAPLTLSVRVPSWAEGVVATVRGERVEGVHPGRFLRLRRRWRADDELRVSFEASVRVECLPDARPEYQQLCAVLLGPVVLAALTYGHRDVAGLAATEAARHVRPLGDVRTVSLRFQEPSTGAAWLVSRGEERTTSASADSAAPLALPEAQVTAGSPELPRGHRGGTDAALRASFVHHEGGDGVVRFESLDRPGCFLACVSGTVRLVCGGAVGDVPGWRVVGGGALRPAAAASAGTLHVAFSGSGAPRLACAVPPPGRLSASVRVGAPSSRLPAGAHVLAPRGRGYLLVPLHVLADERYAAYLRFGA